VLAALSAAALALTGRLGLPAVLACVRVDGVTFGAIVPLAEPTSVLTPQLIALARTMEAPFEIGNQDLIVSIGLGASQYPKDASTAHEVARLAELAKLQTHAEPGNTHVVYESRIGEGQRDKLQQRAVTAGALCHGRGRRTDARRLWPLHDNTVTPTQSVFRISVMPCRYGPSIVFMPQRDQRAHPTARHR